MSTTRVDIPSLQQLIRELSRPEREELAEWILNCPDNDWVREVVPGTQRRGTALYETEDPVEMERGEAGEDVRGGAREDLRGGAREDLRGEAGEDVRGDPADAELSETESEFGAQARVRTVTQAHSGRLLSVDEYLQRAAGGVRYEYLSGQIFAMASPVVRHDLIVSNVTYQIRKQLRGGEFRTWSSDVAVRIKTDLGEIFYIPDVCITCEPLAGDVLGQQYLTRPKIVIEVVSASTESIDRREKSWNYRHLPSVDEILLIAQRTTQVVVLRRRNFWAPELLTRPQDVFESTVADLRLMLSDIYDGVR